MNYGDANGALPPTAIFGKPSNGLSPDFSMKARMLPYIEANSTYSALNSSAWFNSVQNFTVRIVTVTSFLCPSDGNNPSSAMTVGALTGTPASTSYPNNIGTFAPETGGIVDGPAYYPGTTS